MPTTAERTVDPSGGPMVPRPYQVTGRREEIAGSTVTLTLRAVDEPIDPPRPGQFTMLWMPGIGEVPISLAGIEGDEIQHTIRAVGATTNALCALRPGDQIGVRGPFGIGWDLDAARGRDVLIVAGGLGLVPLRPVIHAIRAERDLYGTAALVVGSRSPATILYRAELDEWADDLAVALTVDAAGPEWRGHVGVVTELLGAVPTDPTTQRAFVCGPEVMMRFAAVAIADRGTPSDAVGVSLERNMHCAIAHCGRCQLGPTLLCRDGPVLSWTDSEPLLKVRGR